MRSGIVAIIASVAVIAAAQSLDGLPSCAQTCVTGFTSGQQIGGCPSLSVSCICSNKDFLNNIACCLADKCDQADQETAVNFAKQLCATANVQVPDQVVCNNSTSSASSGTSSTASGAAVSTGSSTAASTTTTSSSSSSSSSGFSSSTAASTSTSASASATPNIAAQKAGHGLTIAGGLAVLLAFL